MAKSNEKGNHYYPFYYQRFFSSTMGWTEEQQGCYLRLLTYQFENGFIPSDPKKIKKISPKAIKNWNVFESKFEQKSEGKLINYVMDELREKILAKRDKNLENGKLGGRPKTERLPETEPNGYQKDNRTGVKNETQTEPIPITNNQYTKEEYSTGLAQDMLRSFKTLFPKYPEDREKDFSALVAIAYKISGANGWTKEAVVSERKNDVCKIWEEIIGFVVTDDWFRTRSISDLNKEWQRLMQSVNKKVLIKKEEIQQNPQGVPMKTL